LVTTGKPPTSSTTKPSSSELLLGCSFSCNDVNQTFLLWVAHGLLLLLQWCRCLTSSVVTCATFSEATGSCSKFRIVLLYANR
jgi:hypothetical protein